MLTIFIGLSTHKIKEALEKTILYLKNNARRDSIKRDKKSGHSKLGLNPLYGV